SSSADGFGVTLFNTGICRAAARCASGGDGNYDLSFVTINGSVGTFDAPDGRLRGPVIATTGFGAMTLGDVLGPITITVPASSLSPSFTMNDVQELTINSPVGIDAIDVRTWIDVDATPDQIAAPWIGSLTTVSN